MKVSVDQCRVWSHTQPSEFTFWTLSGFQEFFRTLVVRETVLLSQPDDRVDPEV